MFNGLNAHADPNITKMMEQYDKVLNSKSLWLPKSTLEQIIESDIEDKMPFFWKYVDWCEENFYPRACYQDINKFSQKLSLSKNEVSKINTKKMELISRVFEAAKGYLENDRPSHAIREFEWLTKRGFKVPAKLYLDAIVIALNNRKIVTVPEYIDNYKSRYSKSERNSKRLTQVKNRLNEMRIELPMQYASAIATNPTGFKPHSVAVKTLPSIPKGVKKSGHCVLSFDLRSGKAVNVKIESCTDKKLKKAAKKTLNIWQFNHPKLDGKIVEMVDLKEKIIFDVKR